MSIPSLEDVIIPNQDNPHNYVLDTTAFNRFAEKPQWLDWAVKSLNFGFCYFITINQNYELSGMGAKVYDRDCYPEYYKAPSETFRAKMQKFPVIEEQLKIRRISSIASLMTNHWILDGTYRIHDDCGEVGKTTEKIFNFNEKLRKRRPFAQHYDAMTAEAALYHHCILVTDDDDLRDMVNDDFPDSAISTHKLLEWIREIVKEDNHDAQ